MSSLNTEIADLNSSMLMCDVLRLDSAYASVSVFVSSGGVSVLSTSDFKRLNAAFTSSILRCTETKIFKFSMSSFCGKVSGSNGANLALVEFKSSKSEYMEVLSVAR
mgnify:CR=1 FL=1